MAKIIIVNKMNQGLNLLINERWEKGREKNLMVAARGQVTVDAEAITPAVEALAKKGFIKMVKA